jgi:hypothetical protein
MEENQLIFVYIHLDQFLYLKYKSKILKIKIINNSQTYCKGIISDHHNLCTTVDVRTHVNCAQSKRKNVF